MNYTLYQYSPTNIHSCFNFEINTSQRIFLEVASYKEYNSSSEYTYDNLLVKLVESAYVGYPVHLFVELYQSIEDELLGQHVTFEVLCKLHSTKLYHIQISNRNELNTMLKYFYTSGIDSLFNVLSKSTNKISVIKEDKLKLLAYKDPHIPCFSFVHDLQGLMLFGEKRWVSKDFIKGELLKGSSLIDELEVL